MFFQRFHITPLLCATSIQVLPPPGITSQNRNREEWAPHLRCQMGKMSMTVTNSLPSGKTLVSPAALCWNSDFRAVFNEPVLIFQSRQEENALVPVPSGPATKWWYEWEHLVGGSGQGHFPVLHETQRSSGQQVGCWEGQPQNNDLSKDGPSAQELWQNRGDQKSEEKAHLPVQWGGAQEQYAPVSSLMKQQRL